MREQFVKTLSVRDFDFERNPIGIGPEETAALERDLKVEFHPSFRDYLSTCVPKDSDGIGYVDWLCAEDIRGWNLESDGSINLLRHGFVTFAHNSGPELYCWEMRHGRILKVGHGWASAEEFALVRCGEKAILPYSWYGVFAICSQSWEEFEDFLAWLFGKVSLYGE